MLKLAEALARHDDGQLRGFFSHVRSTYSPELALDVAVAAILAARIAPPSE